MSWIIISIILFFIVIYTLDKRIKRLEETRGRGYSHSFNVNVLQSILQNEMFGKLAKIKSAEEGKNYKDWSEEDKDKWHKIYQKDVVEKIYVRLTYLSSEDAFAIKVGNNFGIQLPSYGKDYVYSTSVVGDDGSFEDYLGFSLVRRNIKDHTDKYIHVLSGYLEEHFEDLDKKSKMQLLFDFPFNRQDLNDDYLKGLGFEVERKGGDDIYEDSFGETQATPTMLSFKKNGAEISYIV